MNTKELAVKSFPTPAYHTWNKSHLKELAKFLCSARCANKGDGSSQGKKMCSPAAAIQEPSEYQDPYRGSHVFPAAQK